VRGHCRASLSADAVYRHAARGSLRPNGGAMPLDATGRAVAATLRSIELFRQSDVGLLVDEVAGVCPQGATCPALTLKEVMAKAIGKLLVTHFASKQLRWCS